VKLTHSGLDMDEQPETKNLRLKILVQALLKTMMVHNLQIMPYTTCDLKKHKNTIKLFFELFDNVGYNSYK